MAYKIGVSSGIFSAVEAESKGEYAGLSRKVMFSIFKGVMFTQIDLESISEFKEPELEKKMKEARENLGITYGLHGEVPEYSKAYPRLDTAIRDEWKRSHERFIEEIDGAGKIKSEYLLFHSSTSESFLTLWGHLQTLNVCDIWGRPFEKFIKEHEELLWWAIEKDFVMNVLGRRGLNSLEDEKILVKRHLIQTAQAEGKKPEEIKLPSEEEIEKMAKEELKKDFLKLVSTDEPTYGTERIPYYIIAKWMEEGKECPPELHTLWKDITGGGGIDDDKFRSKSENWVPAVTAAYHWGHFYPEKAPDKKSPGEDPKPLLKKYNMKIVFETPMGGAGGEESMRLARVSHIYYMVKAINNPLVGVAVDAEHILSANIDPEEDIKRLPFNAGEKIFVMHVGYPSPMAPAHIPIMLGSEAQVYVYKLLLSLRKKGMKNATIIFERGGGTEPVKESVLSLRKIVEYLDKDTEPKDLPEDFFGMPKGGPEITRQILSIREHALDPLKGMLSVPEEEYGFLGSAAAAKGKAEEWVKKKLK